MEDESFEQSVVNLRNRFTQECTNIAADERDVDLVQSDDTFLRNYLLDTLGNEDEAFQLLMDCLVWRHTMGVNDVTTADLDEPLVRTGICFLRGHDRGNNACLVLNIRFHRKDAEKFPLMKKHLIYLLEQQRIREPSGKLTIIFDMTDTGLGNMDMEFVRFIIDCFKYYFPNMLNVLLVFEMPFILSTVWKIIKGWLSERAQSKIKFVKKGDIRQHIDSDQLLTSMGGTDTYTFDPDEFLRQSPQASLGHFASILPDDCDDDTAAAAILGDTPDAGGVDSPSARRVHFAEDFSACASPQTSDNKSRTAPSRQDSKDSNESQTFQQRQAHVQSLLQHQSSQSSQSSKDSQNGGSLRRRHVTTAGLMEISPSNVMEFRGNGTEDIVIPLTLQNVSTNTAGFKVKTTGPDRYHVKPSAGIVQTGASAVANVTLRSGSDPSLVSHDKFLVEFCPVPSSLQSSDLSKFWKTVDRSTMQERILRTQMLKAPRPEPTKVEKVVETKQQASIQQVPVPNFTQLQRSLSDMDAKLDRLERNQQVMLRKTQLVTDLAYVFIVFCFVIVLVVCFHSGGFARFSAWI